MALPRGPAPNLEVCCAIRCRVSKFNACPVVALPCDNILLCIALHGVALHRVVTEDGQNFVSFFPSFLWVLRDFNLDIVDDVSLDCSPRRVVLRDVTSCHVVTCRLLSCHAHYSSRMESRFRLVTTWS